MSLVSGTITFAPNIDTRPPVIVKVYDVDLISKQLLGQRTLGPFSASESFEITYTRRNFGADEGTGRADVKVEAISEDGLFAAESNIIFNAPEEVQNLRLVLRPVENPPSEFERLVDELTPLMQGVLPENLTTEQMAFLNRDIEGRLERIIAWHEAAVLTEATNIPVEAGYAWRRLNIQPLTLVRLLELGETPLRRVLSSAIQANIIPDITDQIDDILARLSALRKRVVTGSITFDSLSNPDINEDIIVQAFDKDLRSEELLGEARIRLSSVIGVAAPTSGFYRIEYTEAQFEQDERETADLLIRARTTSGSFTGESAIRFNAGENERIDLVLTATSTPPPEEIDFSELEELQATLEPIRQNIAYADFTDEDIQFLTRELMRRPVSRGEAMQLQQRLEFLRTADRFARSTPIPLAAFYGWFRQGLPTELDALLDTAIARLREALETAIEENIIPDIRAQIPEILDRVRSLRLTEGRLVSHRFVGQLINAETDNPLPGYTIDVEDLETDAEEPAIEVVDTDGDGLFSFAFVLPSDAPEDAVRRLSLTIRDGDENLAEVEITAAANQEDIAEIRVQLRDVPQITAPISDFASAGLARQLQELGITTLVDLLNNPDLTDSDNADELEQLKARAKFAALAPTLENPDVLVNSGFRSWLDVGKTTRAQFVSNQHESLGDARAASLHFAAREYRKVLAHYASSDWLRLNTSDDDDDGGNGLVPPGVGDVFKDRIKCECEDCLSAVSPAAYLSHLLSWTLEHVKEGQADITNLGRLDSKFHQSFGAMPASCRAVEERVRQVRIAVEVLWNFTDLRVDPDETEENNGPGLEPIIEDPSATLTGFRLAYRKFLNELYRTILENLGLSYQQLQDVQLHRVNGEFLESELNDPQRQVAASILGIEVPRLNSIYRVITEDDGPVTERVLQFLFGFKHTQADPFTIPPQAALLTWQRERLETVWQGLDWPSDAYGRDRTLPFIDPAIIDESYLRAPLADNPASILLTDRRAALESHRQQLQLTNPQTEGLNPLTLQQFGQPIEQLRQLHETIQAGTTPEQNQATLNSFNLTVAGLNFLMDIDTRLQNQEAIEDEDWETVFDIFSRAQRHLLFSEWIEQEETEGMIFGPQLFWQSLEPMTELNPWQATAVERNQWEQALRDRYRRRPIIDPNLIDKDNFVVFSNNENSPTLTAFEIWQNRKREIGDRLEALQLIRGGQQDPPLNILQALLAESASGVDLQLLETLTDLEDSGEDLLPHLERHTLRRQEFRYLVRVQQLAMDDRRVNSGEWQQIEAILVNIEKRRQFMAWLLEEQSAGIYLHPDRFKLLDNPKQVDLSSPKRWLVDFLEQQDWEDTLRARMEQLETLAAALSRAVGDAEEVMLPKLRDALIRASVASGRGLAGKATWLDRVLLIDMQMDGCHLTTRVSQAIETLQRLIRGIYTNEHPELLENLRLDDLEDYETEWPVLGSYPTWKAFMMAYLYPENLLHVSPTPRPSHGFQQLKDNLPNRPTSTDVCRVARDYSDYFRDICNLDIQATCQIPTFVGSPDECKPTRLETPSRLHLFALSRESGRIYWAQLDPSKEFTETITSWRPIYNTVDFEPIDKIIGATPHFTPDGKRFIFLFFSRQHLNKYELRFIKYDADKGLGWSSSKDLELPALAKNNGFSAAVIQKRSGRVDPESRDLGFPTLVAIMPNNGSIYLRSLDQEGKQWKNEEWEPLFGSRLIASFREVLALIQRARNGNEYVILAKRNDGIFYRFLYLNGQGRDDLTWNALTKLSNDYLGGFSWFGNTRNLFLFFSDAGRTIYRRLGATGVLQSEDESEFRFFRNFLSSPTDFDARTQEIASEITRFNDEWLEPLTGVSLRDYKASGFTPVWFIPHEDTGTNVVEVPPINNPNANDTTVNPLNLLEGDPVDIKQAENTLIRFEFRGSYPNLLEIFNLKLSDAILYLVPRTGTKIDARFTSSGNKTFYLIQYQFQYIQKFIDFIANIDSAPIEIDPSSGLIDPILSWKLADEKVRRFSHEGFSFARLIRIFRYHVLGLYQQVFNGGVAITSPISFLSRDKSNELFNTLSASNITWRIAPSSGNEGTAGLFRRRAVALQKVTSSDNAPFWMRISRTQDGRRLRNRVVQRIAPSGSGPFDLLPEQSASALQQRRREIRRLYRPLLGSPPSIINYLREAYFLLPSYIAYELQRGNRFDDALTWYRQVFDYTQSVGKRKIDHGLRAEENLELSYADSEDWLQDATNAHAIAATRRATYTRHILIMIIRCMVTYADQLFSYDNATDNARAKELYTLALRLLNGRALKPRDSRCQNILGELEVEIVESSELPLTQLQGTLSQIRDPDQLNAVFRSIRAINQNEPEDSINKLTAIRNTVDAAIAEIPTFKQFSTIRNNQQNTSKTLETHYLSSQRFRAPLRKISDRSFQTHLQTIAEITARSEETLLQEPNSLPWLRQTLAVEDEDSNSNIPVSRAIVNAGTRSRIDVAKSIFQAVPLQTLQANKISSLTVNQGISFEFCIPQNPVVQALKTRAENNLKKLRQCRNIAGLVRQLDPYGVPIGIGGVITPTGQIFSGIVQPPPTIYRYAALITRTKELVNIAQQIEAGYQSALERAENEALTRLQAEQGVELAEARVTLQDLRLNQVNNEFGLAQLQRSSAALRVSTYSDWIDSGKNEHEKNLLQAYRDAGRAKQAANIAKGVAAQARLAREAIGDERFIVRAFKQGLIRRGLQATKLVEEGIALAAESTATGLAINAERRAQTESFEASFERRNDEWQLQQGLAAIDTQIGDQQILIAQNQIDIVRQERAISALEQIHARDVLQFLIGKNFDEEMYRWIASVLEDVYRFFLQEAASIARLAEAQLAFERQTTPLGVIQSDYWDAPLNNAEFNNGGGNVDRLGLTGSARLLQDIYQLDQYAFESRQRKQSLTVTLDLAQLFPAEFQLFRETGVLNFETPMSLLQRQFPGYYLCLIQQVSVSVVALVPTTYGIRATLTSAGISRAVVGGDTFQTVIIRNLPERISLTALTTTSGIVELEPDTQSLLQPFEGSGFDSHWEIRMPKANNLFDYNSMATILFTVEMTALHNFDYEQQTIRDLDTRISAERAFRFRNEFADQWYDLNNPDLTNTPMVVRFETRREDFPPNIDNLKIQHVLLYFIRADGFTVEIPVRHLQFTERDGIGTVGGSAQTIDGVISTRRGNGTSWLPAIGQAPFGEWELAFDDAIVLPDEGRRIRDLFEEELIEDILFVITYQGNTPEWSA